jgi:hypothetical protein
MRAKFVNETQNFERGVHPKQALGVGGLSLGEEKHKMKKKFRDDWNFFLTLVLDGKTISGIMNKRDPEESGNKWGVYTITVDSWEEVDGYDSLLLKDINGDEYILPIDDKKIFIDNAR